MNSIGALTALLVGVAGLLTAAGALLKLRLERRKLVVEEKSIPQQALESALITVQKVGDVVQGQLEGRVDALMLETAQLRIEHKQCQADLAEEKLKGRERDAQMESQNLTIKAQGHQIEELNAQVAELQQAAS